MSGRIKIVPSGHEFEAQGSASVLEEALRAGLSLNYGCSNGNCGLCKARLLDGEIHRVRPVDYVMPSAERAAGMFLMCAHAAAGDLVIEAKEANDARDIPRQRIEARVRRVDAVGDGLRIVHVQTPRTSRLRFLAGQSANLYFGELELREFPIASCPCDDRNLEFHIPRRQDDAACDHVFASLKSGDAVVLDGPFGNVTFQDESSRAAIFLAWGIGFSLIKSLLEHAMALQGTQTFYLYWAATPDAGHYMNNLCRAWADALDNFEYVAFGPPVIGGQVRAWDAPRLDEALRYIANRHAHLSDLDVYVAGSVAASDASEIFFLERGVPRAQLMVKRLPGITKD